MPNIKLKDEKGIEQIYENVEYITAPLADGNGSYKFGQTNNSIEITKNGIYTAPEGSGYSPITVNVDNYEDMMAKMIEKIDDVEIYNDKAKRVGAYAYYTYMDSSLIPDNTSNLISLDLPNATTIGYKAFNGCYKLKTVNIPKVVKIDENAFYGTKELTTINCPSVMEIGSEAFKYSNITSIDLPNMTELNNSRNTFLYSALKSITAPNLVEIKGCDMTFNHTSLESIYFPKLQSIESSYSDVAGYIFADNTDLISLNLPELLNINEYYGATFAGCTNLKYVNMPKLTSIDGYSFRSLFKGCSSLEIINLPS